jgi:hypothetical protein
VHYMCIRVCVYCMCVRVHMCVCVLHVCACAYVCTCVRCYIDTSRVGHHGSCKYTAMAVVERVAAAVCSLIAIVSNRGGTVTKHKMIYTREKCVHLRVALLLLLNHRG